jgi:hypothetical protein
MMRRIGSQLLMAIVDNYSPRLWAFSFPTHYVPRNPLGPNILHWRQNNMFAKIVFARSSAEIDLFGTLDRLISMELVTLPFFEGFQPITFFEKFSPKLIFITSFY